MRRKINATHRMIRGGSWDSDDPADLAVSARNRAAPTIRYFSQGLRLVRKP